MSYFYGPVPSRRLGFSLGVDLVLGKANGKVCNFDCIYCQLGKTFHKSIERFWCIDLKKLKRELKKIIKKNVFIDYISISGSGEPTLHKGLDEIIHTIKEITKNRYPVCVITNGSLLYRKDVRRELKQADLVIPSLDAGTARTFYKVNRPYPTVRFKKIVEGLIKFRKEYKGKLWLEIMLVGGLNDNLNEARAFKKIVQKIKPDKVQLNLPIRPAGSELRLPSPQRIKAIKKIIGGNIEVVSFFSKRLQNIYPKNLQEQILNYLKRRPASSDDLRISSGLNTQEMNKCLEKLISKNIIRKKFYQQKMYFTVRSETSDSWGRRILSQ